KCAKKTTDARAETARFPSRKRRSEPIVPPFWRCSRLRGLSWRPITIPSLFEVCSIYASTTLMPTAAPSSAARATSVGGYERHHDGISASDIGGAPSVCGGHDHDPHSQQTFDRDRGDHDRDRYRDGYQQRAHASDRRGALD